MNITNVAGLINLLGYTIGIALYALLLAIVVRHPVQGLGPELDSVNFQTRLSANWLMLATAILGLLWNVGAFLTYGLKGFGLGAANAFPVLSAISFSALGFLPAVVVQSVILNRLVQPISIVSRIISVAAYCLSSVAAVLFFHAAVVRATIPSPWALSLLTFGYLGLLAILILSTRRQEGWKKAVWASALAIFAVSALHLGHHRGGGADAWYTELTGHHASLLLAFAILYEDYRFAFADIFLKRALSLLALGAIAIGLYFAAVPIVLAGHGWNDPVVFGPLLGLWVIVALSYATIRRAASWFVDAVVLRRDDYNDLRVRIARFLTQHESEAEIMDKLCLVLAPAFSARSVTWVELNDRDENERAANYLENGDRDRLVVVPVYGYVTLVNLPGKGPQVFVPTAEPPYYQIEIPTLGGGRRLLSDDIAVLESVAVMVARRIDALRVTHERCEQNLREQEINKLATEAQLRALRAQVNPHFLFNALTTIGHLVQTAPDRALETLMKLTNLLRGVLRSDEEFVTLGEELKLIGAYLDIEHARFEERLRVSIEVPEDLLSIRLPSLLLQPLVENAIKHGIAPSRFGGEVRICARLQRSPGNGGGELLSLVVTDTGIGASEIELARGRRRGVGLNNIEERLRLYGGQSASMRMHSALGEGTSVELKLPTRLSESGEIGLIRAKQRKEA